jgi:hypothetical protein
MFDAFDQSLRVHDPRRVDEKDGGRPKRDTQSQPCTQA